MRHVPSSLSALACTRGFTVGPGRADEDAGGGGCRGALVAFGTDDGAPDGLEGYLRAALPAVRAVFEAEEPIVFSVCVCEQQDGVANKIFLPRQIIRMVSSGAGSFGLHDAKTRESGVDPTRLE